jgi:glycosyltransferase involved in cell wall biosynthesis
MPATEPKISVIVTCYNLGQYLEQSVASIAAQTCQDFEILIVDDGSTDAATQALLDTFESSQMRVLRAPHRGLAAARNAGIAEARGRYLCALDADDRLAPTYLEKTVRVLDSDPSVTFVSSWLRMFGEREWEWRPERCDLAALLCEDTVLTAALVRREAVAALGGYDAGMPVQGDEDWDLWLTLAEQGYRGVILEEFLFDYRQRPGSMSAVSWYGPGHEPLTNYRVDKHAASYRAHLLDVFRHQDSETAGLLRRNDELERYIGSHLEPAIADKRAQLAALNATNAAPAVPHPSADEARNGEALERAAEHARQLEIALRAATAEIDALRSSLSWKVTGPLRRAYGWWLALRTQK